LAAALAAGCGDNGTGPGGEVTVADLVGTWRATTFSFTSQANASQSFDLIVQGGRMTLTVASDSTYTMVLAPPGEVPDIVTGALVVEEGFLLVTDNSVPGETIAFTMNLSGNRLELVTDEAEFDFDGDGVDEPAVLTIVLQRVLGTTVADLEGSWEASEFRFISAPSAADTVDLIAAGGSFAVMIAADGRYTANMTAPGELPAIEIGTLLIEDNELILVADSDPAKPQVLTFELTAADTLELAGDETFDFDGDGTEDPAVLEVVLQRR
jgi:hypothetical protein